MADGSRFDSMSEDVIVQRPAVAFTAKVVECGADDCWGPIDARSLCLEATADVLCRRGCGRGGRNSPFTMVLLKHIGAPGRDVGTIMPAREG